MWPDGLQAGCVLPNCDASVESKFSSGLTSVAWERGRPCRSDIGLAPMWSVDYSVYSIEFCAKLSKFPCGSF